MWEETVSHTEVNHWWVKWSKKENDLWTFKEKQKKSLRENIFLQDSRLTDMLLVKSLHKHKTALPPMIASAILNLCNTLIVKLGVSQNWNRFCQNGFSNWNFVFTRVKLQVLGSAESFCHICSETAGLWRGLQLFDYLIFYSINIEKSIKHLARQKVLKPEITCPLKAGQFDRWTVSVCSWKYEAVKKKTWNKCWLSSIHTNNMYKDIQLYICSKVSDSLPPSYRPLALVSYSGSWGVRL